MLRQIGEWADERNQGAVIVGGVVRDLALKRPVVDLDVMLDHPARPIVEKLAEARRAKVVAHPQFYTFNVTLPSGKKIDVVTAREETYPQPAALPRVSPSAIDKDIQRRDFTINAMALWLNKSRWGELFDPFSGREDIEKGVVRALHSKSFEDDPTRIFRAARFSSRFGFAVEAKTEAWILKSIGDGLPARLSPVRRRHEFELLLKEENPLPALKQLETWDALRFVHPAWKRAVVSFGDRSVDGKNDSLLIRRLAQWFGQWDIKTAKQMMMDLQFEKAVKSQVEIALKEGHRPV